MIRELMHDPLFLARKSTMADLADKTIAADLADTLRAHRENCAGMAANMIGVSRRIIVFEAADGPMLMLNPELLKHSDPYSTEEGCLSLPGTRKTRRYRSIKVRYQTTDLQTRLKTFSGWTAQIIQHEVDHCNGVLI